MARIFISYAREDGIETAEELADRLRVDHDVFRDVDNIPGSVEWRGELKRQILRADVMIVLVTPESNLSHYVYEEIIQAQQGKKAILPVLVEGTPLPPYMRQYQALKFDGENYDRLQLDIERAIARLDHRKQTQEVDGERSGKQLSPLEMLIAGVLIGAVVFGGVLWATGVIGGQQAPTPPAIAIERSPTEDVIPLPEAPDTPTDEPTSSAFLVTGALVSYLRSSMSADASLVEVFNERLSITGVTADGEFYRVAYEGGEWWLQASFAVRFEGDVNQVPVIETESDLALTSNTAERAQLNDEIGDDQENILRIEVDSRESWQSTDLNVVAGMEFLVSVTGGEWTYREGIQVFNLGEGGLYICGEIIDPKDCVEPLPTVPTGALIGRIGDQTFLIESGALIVAERSGPLELRINDSDNALDDNQGVLSVEIRTEKI